MNKFLFELIIYNINKSIPKQNKTEKKVGFPSRCLHKLQSYFPWFLGLRGEAFH